MIDDNIIDINIENVPKPKFCEVEEQEFREALHGAREAYSNTDLTDYTTESYWTLIYFSACYFCKGMMYAEEKAGLRGQILYPRY